MSRQEIEVGAGLREYFGRPDSPMADSPVGRLMIKVLEKNPGMDFDAARAEAHVLLDRAAGKRNYLVPAVRSPEEHARQRETLRNRFRGSQEAAA